MSPWSAGRPLEAAGTNGASLPCAAVGSLLGGEPQPRGLASGLGCGVRECRGRGSDRRWGHPLCKALGTIVEICHSGLPCSGPLRRCLRGAPSKYLPWLSLGLYVSCFRTEQARHHFPSPVSRATSSLSLSAALEGRSGGSPPGGRNKRG